MIRIITKRNGDCPDCRNLVDYTCSSTGDIATLPKFPNVAAGSTCICTENHSEYMLGADNKWHKIKTYAVEDDAPSGYKLTINYMDEDTIINGAGGSPDDISYSVNGGEFKNLVGIIEIKNVETVTFRNNAGMALTIFDQSDNFPVYELSDRGASVTHTMTDDIIFGVSAY